MKRPSEAVSTLGQGQGVVNWSALQRASLVVGPCLRLCQNGRITDAVDVLNLLAYEGCHVSLTGCGDLVLSRRIYALRVDSGPGQRAGERGVLFAHPGGYLFKVRNKLFDSSASCSRGRWQLCAGGAPCTRLLYRLFEGGSCLCARCAPCAPGRARSSIGLPGRFLPICGFLPYPILTILSRQANMINSYPW